MTKNLPDYPDFGKFCHIKTNDVVSTLRRQHRPGRPQQVYKLTDAADEFFPEDYHGLTNYLLEHAQHHPNQYRLLDYRR